MEYHLNNLKQNLNKWQLRKKDAFVVVFKSRVQKHSAKSVSEDFFIMR